MFGVRCRKQTERAGTAWCVQLLGCLMTQLEGLLLLEKDLLLLPASKGQDKGRV